MSQWPAAKAQRVLAALLRRGWTIKRQTGSHRILQRADSPDYVFAFHDGDEIGPRMLARIARHTGLTPNDLYQFHHPAKGSAGAISVSRNCTRSSPCQRSITNEPAAWTCRPRLFSSAVPSFWPAARNAMALTAAPSADLSRTRIWACPTSSA